MAGPGDENLAGDENTSSADSAGIGRCFFGDGVIGRWNEDEASGARLDGVLWVYDGRLLRFVGL